MSLIPFRTKQADPVREFFNDELFFAPFVSASAVNRAQNWFPALDVAEESQQYTVKADLPGLSKEDVHVSFDNGVLTIEGERKAEEEKSDKNYHRVERTYGKFVRSINVGTAVDPQGIKANYKDGVLNLILPKSERAKAKTIDINVG